MKAPPPPRKPGGGVEMPALSLRIDPFNWLLDGRLGFELEAEVLSFMSVELVPVFIVNDQPPYLSSDLDELVTQHSNGLGALSGASLGVGFWFAGKPLRGNVFRIIFTNYGMTYRTRDAGRTFDEVSRTERRIYGYLGSHSVYGKIFTIAAGVGLGWELNQQKRCFVETEGEISASSDCDENKLLIRTSNNQLLDLNRFLYPADLMGRISLGVTLF